MQTPDQRPGKMIVIGEKTKLRKDYHYFPVASEEEYKELGIPLPLDERIPSVNFLEWFDAQLNTKASDADILNIITSQISINPYLSDHNMVTLSMGSDDFMRMSWTYPQVKTNGNFQLITLDPNGSPMQLEVPSLKGIEKWAREKGDYMQRRMFGISLVDELEEKMIEAFQKKLLPLVCETFEQSGVHIDSKKISPTRFNFIKGYIDPNQQSSETEVHTVTQTNRVLGVTASFVEVEMNFQI